MGKVMTVATIKKMELIKKIEKVPEQNIEELELLLKTVLEKLKIKKQKPVSLKGIWRNKGFEKINNLEKELKAVRKELNDAILKKDF